ncbi:MAG: T9SS type A sorting domain-containing protein, partial [Lewinella sp.]
TTFRNTRTSFNGDLAHLISRGAPAGGGIAYVDALCTNFNYAYSYVNSSYANVPTYSWTVNVITHEMGHNLGSYHTHDCVWNGTNTAIDGCGPAAGYAGTGSCSAAPLPPVNGGTVMSYCHLLGNVGIGLANGFGPQPGNLIRAKVDAAGCLSGCAAPDCFLVGMSSTLSACNATTGTATATVNGGTAPLTYSWSNGATTAVATGLAPGSYSVTITDGTNCSEVHSVNVGGAPSPVLDMDGWAAAGTANGRARVRVSGGTPPYSYAWSNGATNNDLTNLVAGTYTVTVTDNIGCTAVDNFMVADGAAGCTSGTILRLTIQADQFPEQTSWQLFDDQTQLLDMGRLDLEGTSPGGLYSYVFCLPDGCYALAIIDSQSNGICNASSNPPGFFELEDITNGGIVNSGCNYTTFDTHPFCLGNNSLLTMSATDASCAGAADGTATVSDLYSQATTAYAWSNGGTTASISGLTAGTYTVTVTNNIYLESASVTVGEPAVLMTTTSSTDANNGSNGTATANVTGGTSPYSYAWSNGGTTGTISGLAAGTYSVTVTDVNGCTTSANATVITSSTPLQLSIAATDLACFGDTDAIATVSATGGDGSYAYSWVRAGSPTVINTTATAGSLGEGTYTVTVTSSGQTTTASVTIGEPAAVQVNVTSNNSAQGQATGNATATPAAGIAPYTFLWSNGATTQLATGLAAGTYTVTVTDANGCTATASTTVGEYTPGLELLVISTDATCNGGTDGTADAQASGGVGNYAYLWSNGATTATINGLTAGSYFVTVTSGSQTNTGVTIINEPAAITLNGTVTDASNGANGSVTVNPSGGTGPYTYLWNIGNQTTATINDLPQGFYTCTVTDANGCTASQLFTVTNTTPACNDEEIFFRIQLDDNPGETTWNLKDGNGQIVASGGPYVVDFMYLEYSICLPAGCYDLTVFDTGGNGLGSGYYEITKNNSLVLSGGQFGASETQNFCIGATPQIVFERGRISTTGDGWQTVQLSNQYTNPVVIATPVITSTSLDPVVARVRNAGASSFQVRAQRPGASTNDSYDIEYLVVEEGVYDFPTYGVKMEAVLTTSVRTAARSRWGSNYRETRSYQNAYLNPVVLGQVMSQNDADFSVFWASRSNTQSSAPTQTSFAAGKHVAEDTDRTRSNESLGYVVIEAGSGTINGEEFVAGVGTDIVRGQQNSSLGYLYNVPSNLYLLGGVLSSAAMDGGDGGWPVFKAAPIGTGGFRLAIEEDQIRDNERNHTTEQSAYLMFGIDLGPTPESAPSEEVTVASSTHDLPEVSSTTAVKVFPNPTSDHLNVVYKAAEGAPVQITVWDLTGRKVLEQSTRRTVRATLDVSHLKAGIYLLDLRSGNDRQTKRFIVN